METGLESKPLITYGGEVIGKPVVFGNTLFVSDRPGSQIAVVNIAKPENLILLDTLHTGGTPGRVAVHNGALVIPDGYHGLLVCDHYFQR